MPLLLAALVFGGGYWYFRHQQMAPNPQASGATVPAVAVTVSRPLVKNIVEWDEFTGQFEAVDSVEIRARVSGYLDSIHFEDGQMVKKGDLLFVIDQRPFQISLSSAQSALTSANARLAFAKSELGRAAKLRQSDYLSQSTYDQRMQETQSASADAQVATSAINAAQLNLEFTQIASPISGRMDAHEVSIGNLISGGDAGATTLLANVVSLDPIHFIFDMSEADFLAYQRAIEAGKLQNTREGGVKVSAHLMDETKWSLQGTLDFVNNQVDRTAGTIRARAVFPNADLLITPGQFGRIRIPGSEPYDAIMIPDSAILSDQSQKIVMVVNPDDSVAPRVIRPGPAIDGLRVVREGLSKDDVIIIDGIMHVRPGAKVIPHPGKIEATETE
ncbi:MAG TPA: efflux RND transporter periplasmic adaptor subunit [Dongiaceae bacterium]